MERPCAGARTGTLGEVLGIVWLCQGREYGHVGGREHHARWHVEACRVECSVTIVEEDECGRLEEEEVRG